MVASGKCNILLQKMHTVSARPQGDRPADWQEFPQLGNLRIRMTGGRGANSTRERGEVRQPT
jgi:hypothetical protein